MKCMLGWADEVNNKRGRCCCNCKWQRPISGHPWNHGEFRSPVSAVIAYGCTYPELKNIMLMTREHSMCEVHAFKDDGSGFEECTE